jgi:Ca2+:H+ antiporter
MNGNIALSMEIGSAYVLQVCLLQIPALVFFSAVHGRYIDPDNVINYIFSKLDLHGNGGRSKKTDFLSALIFPQWDMVTVILCVFLLSYVYGEGKSNYFKGSILILAYCVVVAGFYFASLDVDGTARGVVKTDTLAVGSMPALMALVN